MPQPPPVVACKEFSLSPHTANLRPKKSVRVFENAPKPTFSKFSLNETAGSSFAPLMAVRCAAVQPRCISLQNFAFCAMAGPLQCPTARLGCRFVCTTSGFAQKTDAKPVGGRGISAFSEVFLLAGLFFGNRRPWRCNSPIRDSCTWCVRGSLAEDVRGLVAALWRAPQIYAQRES